MELKCIVQIAQDEDKTAPTATVIITDLDGGTQVFTVPGDNVSLEPDQAELKPLIGGNDAQFANMGPGSVKVALVPQNISLDSLTVQIEQLVPSGAGRLPARVLAELRIYSAQLVREGNLV